MQQNLKEIPHNPSGEHPFDEAAGREAPVPVPQSGTRILVNIFFFLILLPSVVMLLARLLID